MIFHRETNFKETFIGRIPDQWRIVRLSDKKVSSLIKSGSTPPRSKPEYWNGDIPFVTIGDMTKVQKYLYETKDKITKAALNDFNGFLVPPNSILLSMYGTIGKIVINKTPVAISQNIAAIIPNFEYIDEEFLYYALQQYSFQFSKAKIITLRHLDIRIVKDIKIPLPPLEEQKAIARVLSIVDEAIYLTDEVIKRVRRIRQGLMQILFTRGIGHKEYKQTEIGIIPKEWDVVELARVVEIRGNKRINIPDKIAFIPMEKVPEESIYCGFELRNKNDVKSFVYCEAGDLLLAKITPSFENGKQGIVPEDIPNGYALATTEVYPIVPKRINKYYLFYILKYSRFRKVLEFSMRGTTGRRRVPKNAILKLKIPLPPLKEQEKIANILLTIDKKLDLEYKRRYHLERIRFSLMNILLTGKIRVRFDR